MAKSVYLLLEEEEVEGCRSNGAFSWIGASKCSRSRSGLFFVVIARGGGGGGGVVYMPRALLVFVEIFFDVSPRSLFCYVFRVAYESKWGKRYYDEKSTR